jgi:hypothetical protein
MGYHLLLAAWLLARLLLSETALRRARWCLRSLTPTAPVRIAAVGRALELVALTAAQLICRHAHA